MIVKFLKRSFKARFPKITEWLLDLMYGKRIKWLSSDFIVGAGRKSNEVNLSKINVNELIPALCKLIPYNQNKQCEIISLQDFNQENENSLYLKSILDKKGSDKSSSHNYHTVYEKILRDRKNIKNIFEVGLGTNNTKIISNMGENGIPGASLRSFREYCPNANIYGADFDKGILFKEERIETFFVDQTKYSTFDELYKNIPSDLDLVVSDGLHINIADLNTLIFGLNKIKIGGWIVVEDIDYSRINIWKFIASSLSNQYKCFIIKTMHSNNLFLVNKLSNN